tara:strand:- start:76 stop:444 length:369 start_codon:yes stop_codon:yes gene_type:complete
MNSNELHKKLAGYVGLRVRISSDATSSGSLWRDSYPELVEVVTRETDGAVCCKTNDGVWSVVVPEGLTIEIEPALGTHDFAEPVKQMELIGAAVKAYHDAEAEPPTRDDTPRRRRKMDWDNW